MTRETASRILIGVAAAVVGVLCVAGPAADGVTEIAALAARVTTWPPRAQ